jgi:hypothetical protein
VPSFVLSFIVFLVPVFFVKISQAGENLVRARFLREPPVVGFPNSLGGRDFFVKPASPAHLQRIQNKVLPRSTPGESMQSNCRSNIQRILCLVEPLVEGQEPEDRPCLPGGKKYAIFFEELYDAYPPALQKIFCSLDYLFIESNFQGTAYAGTLEDKNGQLIGALMGIRQSVLDQNISLTHWSSWKEQLSFGGAKENYKVDPNLPLISTQSQLPVNDFLYFVVAHEFGHIFDFANSINKFQNCPSTKGFASGFESLLEERDLDESMYNSGGQKRKMFVSGDNKTHGLSSSSDERKSNIEKEEGENLNCEAEVNSWTSLTWATIDKPVRRYDFQERSGLCFYNCEAGSLSRGQVPQVYMSLADTSFISTYAATNPWDDFADSLAYFLMDQKLGTTYSLDTRQGDLYDIMAKLNSRVFSKKHYYISEFLKRADIVYP